MIAGANGAFAVFAAHLLVLPALCKAATLIPSAAAASGFRF